MIDLIVCLCNLFCCLSKSVCFLSCHSIGK